MGRLYLSPTELTSTPVSLALASKIAQLQAIPGALDVELMKASQRVDGFCKKRIGAPPTTSISGVASIPPGSLSIPVASTQGIDEKEEQAVYLGPAGATQELLPILGVSVTTPATPPYPGSILLAAPTANNHNAGEPVQVVYQEVATAGFSGWEPYTTTIITQEAEIALAHAPIIGQSGAQLTRRVFVKHYPIIAIYAVEHAYPFSDDYGPVTTQGMLIDAQLGIYKLSLGSVVIPRGMLRTTYSAGYTVIPEDVKLATAYYFADALQPFFNLPGALQLNQGKRKSIFAQGTLTKSTWVMNAEQILTDGEYVRET